MYASYDFYKGPYGGSSLSETEWPQLEQKAAAFIDRITFNRLKQMSFLPDEGKMAVCAVAEIVAGEARVLEQSQDEIRIKSFQNDGYSETYRSVSDIKAQFFRNKLSAAEAYLPLSHPLRYAGV